MTANNFYHFVCDLILFIFGCVPSPMNCLYCATLHCRSLINSHLCRVHHIVACLKITAKKCIFFSSVLQFHVRHFHLLPFNALHFYVMQVNSLQLGPSISGPAVLMVRYFHARHFQTKSQCPVSYGHDQYTCRKSRRFKRYRGNSQERKRPETTCKPRALLIHHQ